MTSHQCGGSLEDLVNLGADRVACSEVAVVESN